MAQIFLYYSFAAFHSTHNYLLIFKLCSNFGEGPWDDNDDGVEIMQKSCSLLKIAEFYIISINHLSGTEPPLCRAFAHCLLDQPTKPPRH